MPESSDWVRVTQKDTGHHITVAASLADDPGFHVLKDQSGAVNASGDPNPPEYSDGSSSSSSKKTASGATEKES